MNTASLYLDNSLKLKRLNNFVYSVTEKKDGNETRLFLWEVVLDNKHWIGGAQRRVSVLGFIRQREHDRFSLDQSHCGIHDDSPKLGQQSIARDHATNLFLVPREV